MHRVVKDFEDLQDNRHAYKVGDEYPRKGLKVADERIMELATNRNRRRVPLIEEAERPKRKTKAEMLAEAEELGIDVPKGATVAEIQGLLEASE